MRRRYLLLALWLLGIVAPMAWFARFSAGYSRAFEWAFGSDVMHVLTHVFLFAVLAYMLAAMLAGRVQEGGRVTAWVFGFVLLVAFLQEMVQLWYKARPFGYPEWFDLGVDLTGAGLGLAVFWLRRRFRRRQGD